MLVLFTVPAFGQSVTPQGAPNTTIRNLGKYQIDSLLRVMTLKNTNGDLYMVTTDTGGRFILRPVPAADSGIFVTVTRMTDSLLRITAGTNINISGTYPQLTIDAIVPAVDSNIFVTKTRLTDSLLRLTPGTNITITGTYPNLTISETSGGVTSVNGSSGAITGVWTNGGNNHGTNPSIGTSNNTGLIFMSNGTNRGRIAETGEWIFGQTTVTSGYNFQVKGYTNTAALIQNTQSASSGNQVSMEINPILTQSGTAGYTGLLVNATESTVGSGTSYFLRGQTASTDRFRLRTTGLMEGPGMGNITSTNNALLGLNSTGVSLSRSIADASPAVIITQASPSSTGDILRANNSAGTVFKVAQNGNTTIADGTQSNGYVAVSDANGKLVWTNPTSITTAPPATPSWNSTLAVNPVSSAISPTVDHSTGTHGYYLTNSGNVIGKYEMRNADAAIRLTSGGTNTFDATGDAMTVSNGTDISQMGSQGMTLKNKSFYSDHSPLGGMVEAFNRYTATSVTGVPAAPFSYKLVPNEWVILRVRYIGIGGSNRTVQGELWGSARYTGGAASIEALDDYITKVSGVAGADCKIAVSGDDVIVTVESTPSTDWQIDVYFTVFQY